MNNTLIDNCKKYLGIYPYNDSTNVVTGDPYFYIDMCKKYGKENVDNAIKQFK